MDGRVWDRPDARCLVFGRDVKDVNGACFKSGTVEA